MSSVWTCKEMQTFFFFLNKNVNSLLSRNYVGLARSSPPWQSEFDFPNDSLCFCLCKNIDNRTYHTLLHLSQKAFQNWSCFLTRVGMRANNSKLTRELWANLPDTGDRTDTTHGSIITKIPSRHVSKIRNNLASKIMLQTTSM